MIIFQTKVMSFFDKNGQVVKNIATVEMDTFMTKAFHAIMVGPYQRNENLKILWRSPIISSKTLIRCLRKKLEIFINTALFLLNLNGKKVFLIQKRVF